MKPTRGTTMTKNSGTQAAERAIELAETEESIPYESLSFVRTQQRYRKRLAVLRGICLCLSVALVTFVGLFLFANARFEAKCSDNFYTSIANAAELFEINQSNDFDYDVKYREIVAELNTARNMLFLMNSDEDRQICMNELYYASIQLPNQIKLYSADITIGLKYLTEGQDTLGYSTLRMVIDNIDRLDV